MCNIYKISIEMRSVECIDAVTIKKHLYIHENFYFFLLLFGTFDQAWIKKIGLYNINTQMVL